MAWRPARGLASPSDCGRRDDSYVEASIFSTLLGRFIESLGFQAVLSEKGGIAYAPDRPLDDSCCSAVTTCNLFVLLLGGRYGAAAGSSEPGRPSDFFQRYDSITKREYQAAVQADIPVYTFVDVAVYNDYRSWHRNGKRPVQWAHVDSENIFHLLELILSESRNNPIHPFTEYVEIETWLRQQWSGLFAELLRRMSVRKELSSAAATVAGYLNKIAVTTRDVETILQHSASDDSSRHVQDVPPTTATPPNQTVDTKILRTLKDNALVACLTMPGGASLEPFAFALTESHSLEVFLYRLAIRQENARASKTLRSWLEDRGFCNSVLRDLSTVRMLFGKPPFAAR